VAFGVLGALGLVPQAIQRKVAAIARDITAELRALVSLGRASRRS
jgi:hypothetical protein